MAIRTRDRSHNLKTRQTVMRTKDAVVKTRSGIKRVGGEVSQTAKRASEDLLPKEQTQPPEQEAAQKVDTYIQNNTRKAIHTANDIGRQSFQSTVQRFRLKRQASAGGRSKPSPDFPSSSPPRQLQLSHYIVAAARLGLFRVRLSGHPQRGQACHTQDTE